MNAFENFISLLKPILEDEFQKVQVIEGKKYNKVITVRNGAAGGSAYAFVDKVTGNIFKPASWSAPAKHERGNINDENPVACCGKYGVSYLK